MEHGATEDQAIAALLHDAIEDSDDPKNVRYQIWSRFGDNVERIVLGCSDSDGGDKAPWLVRKCRYLAHLPEADPDVLLVSAADKLHNMRSILADLRDPAVGQAVFERFKAGRVGTLWYYGSLIAVYRASGKVPARLVAELEAALGELEGQAGGPVKPYPDIPELPPRASVGSLAPHDVTELLTIYGEGCKVALQGVAVAPGRWLYCVGGNDWTWELWDEADQGGNRVPDEPVFKGELAVTFEAALRQLDDQYRGWILLHPQQIHPDIVEALAPAVELRIDQFKADHSVGDWERTIQEARAGRIVN